MLQHLIIMDIVVLLPAPMTPEAVEAVLEAPAKRSRRDPVKKTPVKSVKKATPPAKKF
jgi:hypothetical protein